MAQYKIAIEFNTETKQYDVEAYQERHQSCVWESNADLVTAVNMATKRITEIEEDLTQSEEWANEPINLDMKNPFDSTVRINL